MKDRDISILDFFKALQREYICLEIRSKIYISKNDKDYFRKLMDKKKEAIKVLAGKNDLKNIIEHDEEYLRVWKEIVPKFGFPKLIYNIGKLTDAQLSFPYAGTAVKAGKKYGMCHKVNFDSNTIDVVMAGDALPTRFDKKEIKRLDHLESDEYFYYYPFNSFNTTMGIGILQSYDMNKKEATISFESTMSVTLSKEEISRIL